ncbi:MAG: alanine:cation symporter family protein [Intestinimonas sp.]|nr:alanine:cation symporter family protein [Intestinimonas sp.]
MTLTLLADRLWNPWLLAAFLLTGLYYSVRSGFFQIFEWKLWMRTAIGGLLKRHTPGKDGDLTQLQALSTALASTIGTGSIAGVATAIFFGGPGAVFWMWVSAFLSMMTGCAEKTLAVRYRRRGPDGKWRGGPMEYMERGLHMRPLAAVFALACIAASLCGGDMVQSNSIATAMKTAFGWDRLAVGVVLAVLTGLVMMGGIGRIGTVCERLVPAMALLFLCGGGYVLWIRHTALPSALREIVLCALSPRAALSGGAGYSMAAAMRYGVARGVFTNEAGLGSSAMAHAAAQVREPAEQGMRGLFEVFFATLVVCTVTALVILTSGAYDPTAARFAMEGGMATEDMLGAALSAHAFSSVLGWLGGPFVALCLLLFAFSSLLGWSYYGQQCLTWLTGGVRWARPYQILFLLFTVAGSVGEVGTVWQLADLCNGLMAMPNLLALLLLSPEALRLIFDWTGVQKKSA